LNYSKLGGDGEDILRATDGINSEGVFHLMLQPKCRSSSGCGFLLPFFSFLQILILLFFLPTPKLPAFCF
jgi:hypothetical protein